MNKTISITIFATLLASSVQAADMPRRVNALPPQVDALASDMAHYRAIAIACRASDGSNLNESYWSPRLSIVPVRQKALFAATVKARSAPEIAAMSGPDSALRCDDALDRLRDTFPSIAEAGAAAEPVCWSDVIDADRCAGTGTDDVLAGVDALVDGY